MIPFDITVSFVAGQMLAFSARKQLKSEASLVYNKYLYIAILWMALLYAPSAMFFYHEWTDWNTMYVLKPEDLPGYVIWLDASALVLTIIAGFISAHILIKKEKDNGVIVSSVAALILLGIFLLVTYDRGFYVGTYDEWKAGTAGSLWSSDVLTANIIAGIIDLGPLAYLCYRFLSEESKQVANA